MILWIVLAYLGIGLLFLVVFQLTTRRISKRIRDVSADIQVRLMHQGATIVGIKTAVILTLVYAWVAWVFVLIGYLIDEHDRKQENK